MGKVLKATTFILAASVFAIGSYGIYHYVKQQEELKKIKNSVWTIEQTAPMELQGITISSDSLFTEALDALLGKKIADKKLEGKLHLRIHSSTLDMNSLERLEVKLTNTGVTYTDSAIVKEKKEKEALCELELAIANIHANESMADTENILNFLHNLTRNSEISVAIKPYFGKGDPEWIEASF